MGIKKTVKGKDLTVPEFAMQPPDGLAQVIVDAWDATKTGAGGPLEHILDRTHQGYATPTAVAQATAAINAAAPGFNLKRAVIISEDEHDSDYWMETPDDVVFVLPNKARLGAGADLLQTAKLLMACTPNGI
jgi:hypothetical protein